MINIETDTQSQYLTNKDRIKDFRLSVMKIE